MAKRITISIPDELAQKYEDLAQPISPSELFQNSLKTFLRKRKAVMGRLEEEPGMEDVLERFQKEKLEMSDKYIQLGKKDAVRWAKASHYADLRTAYLLGRDAGIFRDYSEKSLEAALSELQERCDDDEHAFYWDIREQMALRTTSPLPGEDAHWEDWWRGWWQGIGEFWNYVEERLKTGQ